jgi:excisionase family DNA binding protein
MLRMRYPQPVSSPVSSETCRGAWQIRQNKRLCSDGLGSSWPSGPNIKKNEGISLNFSTKDAYSVMLKDYPDVLDIDQMSEVLGVSKKTGYKLLQSGAVTCLKIGRCYRIPKAHLLVYLQVGKEIPSGS